MKNWRNYTFWAAIAAFVGMLVQDMGFVITPEKYQEYVDSILYILVLAGVVTNTNDLATNVKSMFSKKQKNKEDK